MAIRPFQLCSGVSALYTDNLCVWNKKTSTVQRCSYFKFSGAVLASGRAGILAGHAITIGFCLWKLYHCYLPAMNHKISLTTDFMKLQKHKPFIQGRGR
ncbi:hypothetical protein Peur_057579 [Populus x canadensis]